jgi:DNA/RNA-binding domain of Phe-tRNA-synthetase-like protein
VPDLTVAPELVDVCRPVAAWLAQATVLEGDARIDQRLADVERGLRTQPPSNVAPTRTMYKRIGLDPTKTRPSSEALLRRVLKGHRLPRVNCLVDVCNWCSVEFQLPYGLYDLAHVHGDVSLRLGREGESYAGIRKDDVHVAGRMTLADERGPFGNPTSDSARTMVTTATTSALVVVFGPHALPTDWLVSVLDTTVARMAEFTGCRETGRFVPHAPIAGGRQAPN